jgi:hypothetical protein
MGLFQQQPLGITLTTAGTFHNNSGRASLHEHKSLRVVAHALRHAIQVSGRAAQQAVSSSSKAAAASHARSRKSLEAVPVGPTVEKKAPELVCLQLNAAPFPSASRLAHPAAKTVHTC